MNGWISVEIYNGLERIDNSFAQFHLFDWSYRNLFNTLAQYSKAPCLWVSLNWQFLHYLLSNEEWRFYVISCSDSRNFNTRYPNVCKFGDQNKKFSKNYACLSVQHLNNHYRLTKPKIIESCHSQFSGFTVKNFSKHLSFYAKYKHFWQLSSNQQPYYPIKNIMIAMIICMVVHTPRV